MSPSPKLHGLIALGLVLLAPMSSCTLTSDTFNPSEATIPLQPADESESDPDDAITAPNDETDGDPVPCSEGREGADCDIGISMPGSGCESDLDCDSQACVDGGCAAPTCSDERRNGGEAGVDCGGPCAEACGAGGCADDADCESDNCQGGSCQAATCDDGRLNQGEAAPDCAGPCPARCAAGDACTADGDCGAGLFCPDATQRCTTISCQDEDQNGDETAVDCGGGTCPGCPVGSDCSDGADCLTGVCGNNGTCSPASCNDDVRNQNETDVDCGGACPNCGNGETCLTAGDCQSGVCTGAGCGPGPSLCCQAPNCNDNVQNGNEPVADCGNAACGACPLGNPCTANAQCGSGFCQAGSCRLEPCEDGVRNGTETDTDCGGANPDCSRCPLGDSCAGNGDCANGTCTSGECSACGDGQRNGSESDTDCGGVCGDCDPGEDCNSDDDCQSGACQDGRCCGGNQADCTRCARRLASATIDCSTEGPAAQPNCDAFLQCLANNSQICTARHAAGCSEDPGGVCNHVNFGGNGGPGLVLADAIIGTAQCLF